METNSFFDINRLKYLVIRQLAVNYKTLLIATGAVMGILMLIGTNIIFFKNQAVDSASIFGMFLPAFFIGGLIYTSMIFSELNSPHKGYLYLTLPASTLEKLLSAWLVTSVFYVIFGAIIVYIINLYYILIAAIFTSQSVELVNLFTPEVLEVFGTYMVFQTIFLLGAIYFRRVNFLKTLLTGFVLVVITSIYTGILAKILFNHFSVDSNMMNHSIDLKYTIDSMIAPIAKTIFWGVVGPFFLIVSYFRLKERQV